MLHKEYQYFLDNNDKLLNLYKDKFIVIKDQEVIGSYDTFEEAYLETQKNHELGAFLIHHCHSKDEEKVYTYNSRVEFE